MTWDSKVKVQIDGKVGFPDFRRDEERVKNVMHCLFPYHAPTFEYTDPACLGHRWMLYIDLETGALDVGILVGAAAMNQSK
jgi:hypothetical protein